VPAAVSEPIQVAAGDFTGPIHPEVVQGGPGSCPICGMALDMRAPTLDDQPSPELADIARRLWVGLALTIPLVALAVSEMIPVLECAFPAATRAWIQLAPATPVVLSPGQLFLECGWGSLRNPRAC
jgi:Cu+-exporting ATPase